MFTLLGGEYSISGLGYSSSPPLPSRQEHMGVLTERNFRSFKRNPSQSGVFNTVEILKIVYQDFQEMLRKALGFMVNIVVL